jgi:putative transposase
VGVSEQFLNLAKDRVTSMDHWNLPGPPGFVGFRPSQPVRLYHRYLPHWRQEGVTYFTTFRLADSLPQARLQELATLRVEWEREHPPPRSEAQWQDLSRTTFEHLERWLDAGSGCCILRQNWAAEIMEQKLHHFAYQKYELGAYVIMPNHVHLLVRPFSDKHDPLERLEQGWKMFSSREINAARGTKEQLWQFESFDRIVRDEEHLDRCLQYIGNNPSKARLQVGEFRRWINPNWVIAGWDFRSS